MIEVYKIFSGKYDDIVTSWLTGRHVEGSYNLRNHRFSIYQSPIQFDTRNFLLRTELFLLGIVYQILLFQQTS